MSHLEIRNVVHLKSNYRLLITVDIIVFCLKWFAYLAWKRILAMYALRDSGDSPEFANPLWLATKHCHTSFISLRKISVNSCSLNSIDSVKEVLRLWNICTNRTVFSSQVVWSATRTCQSFNLSPVKFPSLGIWRFALLTTTQIWIKRYVSLNLKSYQIVLVWDAQNNPQKNNTMKNMFWISNNWFDVFAFLFILFTGKTSALKCVGHPDALTANGKQEKRGYFGLLQLETVRRRVIAFPVRDILVASSVLPVLFSRPF